MAKGMKANLAKIREHFRSSNKSDNRWLKIKAPSSGEETKTTIRVLPPWGKSADGFFYYAAGFHYGFVIAGRNRAIPCIETKPGNTKPCPVCQFVAKLKNLGEDNKDMKKLSERLRRVNKYFVNVVDRAEPESVKIYGASYKFIEQIIDECDEEGLDVTDLKNGNDITITRTGNSFKTTRYKFRIHRKVTKITVPGELHKLDEVVADWVDRGNVIKYLKDNFSVELEEANMRFGKRHEEDIDEEDEDTPRTKKKNKNGKKKSKVRVVEDDDDDIDLDDYDLEDDDDDDD